MNLSIKVRLVRALTLVLSIVPMTSQAQNPARLDSAYSVGPATISLSYGSASSDSGPQSADVRPIGAGEPATITTDRALRLGSLAIPAGTHSMYALAVDGVWQLIISRRVGQDAITYNNADDIGRVPLTMRSLVDGATDLALRIESADDDDTKLLVVDWGTVKASVPLFVE